MRDLLAGTFNQLVKAVALAADNDGDDGQDGGSRSRNEVGGGDVSTEFSASPRLLGQAAAAAAAAEGQEAGDSVEGDGEVRFVHEVGRRERVRSALLIAHL